eukprot:CAMPEP_0174244746 /NCGR_PEP_ID=MMETSP0417-20130205/36452_1 /TAXON_ID=242541 /ORGANISM="Mayorella sp, Strain BSH-02190019" /LENGTH=144 /DNA_ID=CAMNT_0015324463 /DNA_START=21 /DNA_END=452 /DNA_ORIENTATION=+
MTSTSSGEASGVSGQPSLGVSSASSSLQSVSAASHSTASGEGYPPPSLDEIFHDDDLCAWFLRFLEETRRDENLTCYQVVLRYQAAQSAQARLPVAEQLVNTYLREGAPRQVNIDSALRRSLIAVFEHVAQNTHSASATRLSVS